MHAWLTIIETTEKKSLLLWTLVNMNDTQYVKRITAGPKPIRHSTWGTEGRKREGEGEGERERRGGLVTGLDSLSLLHSQNHKLK